MVANYLVTGGGGFIGSNLVEKLLGSGHFVRVLDDFSTGRRENLASAPAWAADGGGEYVLIEGDIRDMECCRDSLRDIDYVLHQAAIPSVQRSVRDPIASNEVIVNGTLNLLVAASDASVRAFVSASSSSLYGESETLPKIETMPTAPISPYGLAKLAAEYYCMLFHRLYGLPTVALRYFNVFGPRQDPTSEYSAVIPKFMTAIKNGKRPVVYGDGEQSRDFTYIDNVVQANLNSCSAIPEAYGKAYNVGVGERITLNELLKVLGELAGGSRETEYTDPRPGDIRHSLASIELASELLGYKPEVALREGLQRTWENI